MNRVRLPLAALSLALLARSSSSFAIPPATAPAADDADTALVRAAIVKTMPKVKPADVIATATIESLGGRDITVMEILGEIGERLGTSIDDDAVERATNATPSKTMRGLTVAQLAKLTKDARAAAK